MTTLFGPTIHTYTRAEALADGSLIDISNTAKDADITVPIAVTKSVFNYIVDNEAEKDPKLMYMKTYDICSMLVYAAKRFPSRYEVIYPIVRICNGEESDVNLKATILEGDNGEPVFTVSLPNED
ncbi:DUF6573 family protein [Bacillus toyonensis]|uniref:DUF6573 family protein n=1 Tax=Bacillus toyonensis TaxID=155322 RepID=UPI002E20207D|nr:hypothetical protein [Bacillus toyonensis]